MTEVAIRVEDLGKRYRLGQRAGGYRTLREMLAQVGKAPFRRGKGNRASGAEYIWALRHISFEVERGQVLGIIGRNGAGKSTLLKLLSQVTVPTEGQAEIRGRVGSLLEVGTGFHPELTGRENIYLNGAILGMKRAEIDRKFDEMVSFAEVERFIETPVKRYSSGMYLRLAFAVAAHLEPEILIVDEVLAVGDAEFQRKCLGKMDDVAREGRTVIFVSHNMSAILRLTQETILLDQGQLLLQAGSAETVDHYLTANLGQEGERVWGTEELPRSGGPFRPIALRVLDQDGRVVDQVASTKPFSVEFEYELSEDIAGLRIGLYLATSRGEPLLTSFDTDDANAFERHSVRVEGRSLSRCQFPANLLNGGRFVLGVNASSFGIQSYFTEEQGLSFRVDGTGAPGSQWPEPRSGAFRPALNWEIVEAVK